MSRAEHTVEIARPPGEVFPYLVEPGLMTRWIGGLIAFDRVDDAPHVGARSRQKVHQAGRDWDVETEIVELVPDRRLVARSKTSAFTTVLAYDLDAADGGRTRLTGTADTTLRGPGGRLFGSVAGLAAERKLAADLDRLKALLER